mmetsp:Transcript_17846/g.26715  ORF Transcript_17846/g.26715 Transcript_17846/m.26715 type:complete len:237 (+) Transcript_17846:1-711(+)
MKSKLNDSTLIRELKRELAAAHQLTALYKMDDLVWNHISARVPENEGGGFLVTPGRMMYDEIQPEDIVHSSENVTANVIHGAIYKNRPDIGAIVHIHTHAVCTVSTLPQGLQFLTQDAAQFYNNVAYHPWEGISDDFDEQKRLSENLGDSALTLIMRNHGACTMGATVGEAWVRAYYLERVCAVQVASLANPIKVEEPEKSVLENAAKQYEGEYRPGLHEWSALVRMLERKGTLKP